MELFKLFGTIALNGTDKFNSDVDDASSKGSKLASTIGKGLGTAAKVGGAAIAATATAIGVMTKSAVSSYAEYEQLIGGVETLFKDSSEKVMSYANNAYKTAGMSANQYMETVTSFSASLLQSLNGDTAKAAEIADVAISDMSDNANKMGSDMQMIQNAYQGFAKQNYTMLDNLKLGYGGTKEEMERLIADANKLREEQGLNADLTIDSYADVVMAIHEVQEEMGIYGTTANEAASTIQGSISMMKASWENFLTGMSDSTQNFDVLLGNLVDSVVTVADNLIPRIVETVPRLVQGLMGVMDTLAGYMPEIIGSLLPSIISGATSLVMTLVEGIPDLIMALSEVLIESLQQLLDEVTGRFGIASFDISRFLTNIAMFFQNLWNNCKRVWQLVGQPIWDMIVNCIGIVHDVFSAKMPEIKSFVSQCFTDIQSFWVNNLQPCLEAIGNFIENVLAPVFEFVFGAVIGPAVDTAFNFIKSMWEDTLKPVLTGITDFLTGVFTLDFQKAWEGIVSIFKGIINGMIDIIEGWVNSIIDAVNVVIKSFNKIVETIGSLIGIHWQAPFIDRFTLPRLEEGGILEKGQVGLLEGNGAEAVVPLDQNHKWISAVAEDMSGATGVDNEKLQKIIDLLEMLIDMFPETMKEAFASMKFDVNNREFARLVKAVN